MQTETLRERQWWATEAERRPTQEDPAAAPRSAWQGSPGEPPPQRKGVATEEASRACREAGGYWFLWEGKRRILKIN